MTSTQDPRAAAREIIKASIDPQIWDKNEAFTRRLVDIMCSHRLHRHPIVEAFEQKMFTLKSITLVHLEIRAAYLEIFAESLIRLMQTTSQLEGRLGAKAKMAARFLLQLNVMEELGFKPNPAGTEDFYGHPSFSHYWQFTEAVTALGAPEETWKLHQPTPEAVAVRASLENEHDDHLRLGVLLGMIETVYMPYYGPWARNTLAVCKAVDVPNGYHTIHVENEAGEFVDDDHSEDSWYVVRQALTPERYEEIETLVKETLDLWAGFMDMLVNKHHEMQHAA